MKEGVRQNSFLGILMAVYIILSLLLLIGLYSVKPIFNSAHIRSVVYKSKSETSKVAKRNKNDLVVYKEETRYHNVFLPDVNLDEVPNQVLLDLVQGKISFYKFPKEKVTRVKVDFFSFPFKVYKEIQGYRVVYVSGKFYKQPFVKKSISQYQLENWIVEITWRFFPLASMLVMALFAPKVKKAIASYLFLLLTTLLVAALGHLAFNLFFAHWALGIFVVFVTFISAIWLSGAFFDSGFIEKHLPCLSSWLITKEAVPGWAIFLILFGYNCAIIVTWVFCFGKVVFSLRVYLLFLTSASCLIVVLRLVYGHYKNKAPKEALIEHF